MDVSPEDPCTAAVINERLSWLWEITNVILCLAEARGRPEPLGFGRKAPAPSEQPRISSGLKLGERGFLWGENTRLAGDSACRPRASPGMQPPRQLSSRDGRMLCYLDGGASGTGGGRAGTGSPSLRSRSRALSAAKERSPLSLLSRGMPLSMDLSHRPFSKAAGPRPRLQKCPGCAWRGRARRVSLRSSGLREAGAERGPVYAVL